MNTVSSREVQDLVKVLRTTLQAGLDGDREDLSVSVARALGALDGVADHGISLPVATAVLQTVSGE